MLLAIGDGVPMLPGVRKLLKTAPRVLVQISTVAKSNRDKLAGILQYIRLHTPWDVQLIDRVDDAPSVADVRGWRAHGMIVKRMPDERGGLIDLGIPTVVIDAQLPRYTALKKATYITCDAKAVTGAAADHLVGKGFKSFAYIVDDRRSEWSLMRGRLFQRRLGDHGFVCSVYAHRMRGGRKSGGWPPERDALIRWLKSLPKWTAVFVSNDRQARQILQLCQLAKIGIPSELAVLGCDNDELLCENTTPPLSSVEPDFETCGYQAAQLLEGLMLRGQRVRQNLLYGVKRIVERESSHLGSRVPDGRVRMGLDFIRLNAAQTIGVCDIARHMRVSRRMAELLFRKHLDHSITEKIQLARVEKMKRFLADTDRPITMLCDACGYQSEAHAKRLFKRVTGHTMSQFRKEQRVKKALHSSATPWVGGISIPGPIMESRTSDIRGMRGLGVQTRRCPPFRSAG